MKKTNFCLINPPSPPFRHRKTPPSRFDSASFFSKIAQTKHSTLQLIHNSSFTKSDQNVIFRLILHTLPPHFLRISRAKSGRKECANLRLYASFSAKIKSAKSSVYIIILQAFRKVVHKKTSTQNKTKKSLRIKGKSDAKNHLILVSSVKSKT